MQGTDECVMPHGPERRLARWGPDSNSGLRAEILRKKPAAACSGCSGALVLRQKAPGSFLLAQFSRSDSTFAKDGSRAGKQVCCGLHIKREKKCSPVSDLSEKTAVAAKRSQITNEAYRRPLRRTQPGGERGSRLAGRCTGTSGSRDFGAAEEVSELVVSQKKIWSLISISFKRGPAHTAVPAITVDLAAMPNMRSRLLACDLCRCTGSARGASGSAEKLTGRRYPNGHNSGTRCGEDSEAFGAGGFAWAHAGPSQPRGWGRNG